MSNITTKHTTASSEAIIEETPKILAKMALTCKIPHLHLMQEKEAEIFEAEELFPTQSLALSTLPDNILIRSPTSPTIVRLYVSA